MAEEIEDKKEETTSPVKVVSRWMKELDLSKKKDKDWNLDASDALDIYSNFRTDGKGSRRGIKDNNGKETFNILWSNVETKRPALYNQLPKPDIRRRYRDESPVGKAVSEILERCVTYTLDTADFDSTMISGVNDMLLPGRAITRVRSVPTFIPNEDARSEDELEEGELPDAEEVLGDEKVTFEQVQWNDIRLGPGNNWREVQDTWIGIRHRPTKDQVREKWPTFVDKVTYTIESDGAEGEAENEDKIHDPASDATVFNRTEVWEIWDAESQEVIWIAPSYKDAPLDTDDDPMELEGFYPIPEPLYAIENPVTMIPTTEFSMYETLAGELEVVTNRINLVLKGLKVRGIYDGRLGELSSLFNASDNDFIPAENVTAILEKGGLDDAIWFLPIVTLVETLQQLYIFRDQLIAQIYQITGISDIQRGESDPNETASAQRIKADFGSLRLQRQAREVQRYARDLIRIAVDIISGFSRETLSQMSGLNFPTMEQKQQAQTVVQQAQQIAQQTQQPPQIPPDVQRVLETPAWEEIEQVLHNDIQREYLVDVETDSTIAVDQATDQRNMTELMTAIAQYIQGMGPAVQAGALTPESAQAMLLTMVRKFKLGREVEDALDDQAQQPPQDPEAQAAAQEQQIKQQEAQQKQQEAELDFQTKQAESQFKQQELQQKGQFEAQKHQDDMEKLRLDRILNQEKFEQQLALTRTKNDKSE